MPQRRFKMMDARAKAILPPEILNAASPDEIRAAASEITRKRKESDMGRGLSAGNTAADGKENAQGEDAVTELMQQDAKAELAAARADAHKRRKDKVVGDDVVLYVSREKEASTFDLILGPDVNPVPGNRLPNGKLSFQVPTALVERVNRHHFVITGRLIVAE